MRTLDTGYTDLPIYALPVAVAVALASIPRGLAIGKQLTAWYASMRRAPDDVRPGPGHFEVEAIGPGATNLGHSHEPKGPHANPTLTSEVVVLQLVGGPQIRIPAGATIVVKAVAGATRRHVDATTTAQGAVKNRFSFELPAGTRLFLQCELPPDGGTGYRETPVVDVRALAGEYVIYGSRPEAPRLRSVVLSHALGFAFLGAILGLVLTMAWRTGCASGRYPIPSAALADSACFAAVIGALGLHRGLKSAIPKAMLGR